LTTAAGDRCAYVTALARKVSAASLSVSSNSIGARRWRMCHSARAAAIAVAAVDAGEADFSSGAERGGYVAVRQAADEGEGSAVGEDDDVPFEHAAQTLDVGARLVGEVAQGALTDLANLAVVLAQEDGGRRVPVGNGPDIHGGVRAHPTATYKSQILYCMATF
jgi:hypothetical protein